VTTEIVFRPQAEAEARAAYRWYEAQKRGLGAQFADALDDVFQRIASNPFEFPALAGGIRRALLRRFPYGVYFRVHSDTIVVIGIIHGRRHPRRWQTRG